VEVTVGRKVLALVFGALMILVGGVWTLQGLGYLKGSVMTGQSVWAIIGPVLAGFGVALILVGLRGPRPPGPPR
jgi:hypothetical protein